MPSLKPSRFKLFDFQPFQDAAASLKKQRQAAVDLLEQLLQEHEAIEAAPPSSSDWVRAIDRHVDTMAAHYERRLRDQIVDRFDKHPLDIDKFGTPDHPFGVPWLLGIQPPPNEGVMSPAVREEALAYFFPDQVKAGLVRIVESRGTATGADLADREAEVQRLDDEITEVEAELKRLTEVARAAGIYFK